MGAVETIPWVVEAIAKLKEQGAVYELDGDLYFDITADEKFSTYSTLTTAEQISILPNEVEILTGQVNAIALIVLSGADNEMGNQVGPPYMGQDDLVGILSALQ